MSEPYLPQNRQPSPERPPLLSLRTAPAGAEAGGRGDFDLREILPILRRRVWLVLGVAAVCMAFAAFLLAREEPLYRASVVLRTADARRALTGGLEDATADRAPSRSVDPVLSQLRVLQSRSLAASVVDAEGLRLRPQARTFSRQLLRDVRVDRQATAATLELRFDPREVIARTTHKEVRAPYGTPIDIEGVRFTVASTPDVESATLNVASRESAIQLLLRNVEVERQEMTDVIDLSYVASDPAEAQHVVNAIAKAFQARSGSQAQQQSRRRRLFLEHQLAHSDSALANAQRALSEFRSQHQVYSSREKLEAKQSVLLDVELQREEAIADRAMYRSLLAALERSHSRSAGIELQTALAAPGIATNPVLAQLYGQLTKYQVERESLTTGPWARSEKNPDVERLNALIATTQERMLQAIRSHVTSLDARIASLESLQSRTAASLRPLPQSEAEEVRLVQQVEAIGRIGDQLRDEHQKAQMAEAVEVGQVEIVDLAGPAQPFDDKGFFKLSSSLLLGLLLGGGGAVFLELMNTSIRREDELEMMLRVPGLAVIPQLSPASSGWGRWLQLRSILDHRGRSIWVANGEQPREADGASAGVEAYRMLQTSLVFSQGPGTGRVIAVTSAFAGEGKTTTAANLALACAGDGMRVLLIDCDLQCPSLHNVFDARQEPGLAELALGEKSIIEVVRQTRTEGLCLLTSGAVRSKSGRILKQVRACGLFQLLAQPFDLVIVDSPPVLMLADAAVLAAMADGVLLVVRAGTTDRADAQHALRQLSTVGAKIIGAVLNDADGAVARYGRSYTPYTYAAGRRSV